MDMLAHCTKPVKSDTKEVLQVGTHHAAVVFHDGFVSVCDNAFPELTRRGIPSTIFVPSGYLGQPAGWIRDETHPDYGEMVLDPTRLKSLDSDLVTVGSHTVTHAHLPTLNKEDGKNELQLSKQALESILGRPVNLFAFPYGAYTESLVEMTKEVGYQRAFTVDPKLAFLVPAEYLTGSCPVSPTDWNLEFRLKLLGAYSWLPPVYRLKRKVSAALSRKISGLLPGIQRRQTSMAARQETKVNNPIQ
ncbi:MAG: polysaccharide deacetylase family protein [Candidatus Acidiferrales bacterium]